MTQEIGQLDKSPTQVKLCPFYEEEPAIWFRLIEVQFTAAGIKLQKIKYVNALANLPKQSSLEHSGHGECVHESDQPFDDFKVVLLGQFGKRK
jgi:hypothetical protein